MIGKYKEYKEIIDDIDVHMNSSTDYPILYVEKAIFGLMKKEEELKSKLINDVLEIIKNEKIDLTAKMKLINNLKEN